MLVVVFGAAVVACFCAGAALATNCPSSGPTPSAALRGAIPRIVDWEQSENLSPITIRLSRRAMETEKPRELYCSGGVCFIKWRQLLVAVWCAHGRLGVSIGDGGSPWAAVPLPILFWNSLPG